MGQPYDEEKELTEYIWKYCTDFMTDFERSAGKAIVLFESTGAFSVYKAIIAKTPQGTKDVSDNSKYQNALKDGQMAFRQKVMRRLVRKYSDTLPINRCSICNCVAKSPKARLCLWCGHNWYGETN